MEYTPILQNISEDSGIATTSEKSTESNATTSASCYNETPIITAYSSRKRKLTDNIPSFGYETPYESPVIFEQDLITVNNIFSSTFNDSLSKSLEKCHLGTPNLENSSNDYECERVFKKYKIDDSPKYQPKTRSAPSTPTKHLFNDNLNVMEKSHSDQLNGCYYTPKVKPNCTYIDKLGMQERLQLLYPSIQTVSPLKLKTPEKLREFINKVRSPPKKRLFENQSIDGATYKKRIQDPIVLFTIEHDVRHIVSKIFEFLSINDLCAVSHVSKVWRKALLSDYKAFPRYYIYSKEYASNKENILEASANGKYQTPSMSPERDSFYRCRKIASRLSPNQSLQKCPQCMEPAIIQRNISQCQNPNCEYIYCTNCLSFSITGPETFIDKCHMSELLIGGKQPSNRFGLCDISNGNPSPSFFLNESYSTPQLKYDSSGYLSESDASPAVKRNLSVSMETKPLQPVSINQLESSGCRKSRRSSLVAVASVRNTPVILESTEPSSPPKVKIIACSKQSKKNLRRLHF